jgi:hypothetical protein
MEPCAARYCDQMVDFACLYARFDPAVALDADDPAYVDWQTEIGLNDVKQQLANCVRLTTRGYSHRLVTGLRGGGKTTELRRLKRALEQSDAERYFVSFLDADDTLDLDDADPTDLVLAIVAKLVADLHEAGISVKAEATQELPDGDARHPARGRRRRHRH